MPVLFRIHVVVIQEVETLHATSLQGMVFNKPADRVQGDSW